MGTAGECTQTRHLLGVYLLGAIEPAGRAAVDRHLAHCAECRKELAGMAGLPAMLSRVPAADVYQPGEPPPAAGQPAGTGVPGLTRLLRRTATARRARRWIVLAAAAAAVVLAAGLGASVQHLLHPQARPVAELGGWMAVSARNEQTLASATVAYSARGWGTELDVRVRRVPAGTTCQLWVTNRSGEQAEAGGWTIVRGGRAWYPASTAFAASTLRSFVITTGHRTLVSIPVSR